MNKTNQYPLSLPQRDIYFEHQLYPDFPIYNIGAKIEILGELDVEAMQKAYQSLIDQHDAYRIIVKEVKAEALIHILEPKEILLPIVDFSQEDKPEEKAATYMRELFLQPFDLNQDKYLHRFCLVKTGEQTHYLFSVYHHIITDGWGTSLMFKRFTELYNDLVEHGEISHTYPFSYGEFVEENMAYFESDKYKEDADFWGNQFSTLPESIFSNKTITKDQLSNFKSKRKAIYIKRAKFNRLSEVSKEMGVSSFNTILGILYAYFGRFYNNNDFSIGLPVLNRNSKKWKQTVGLFMSVLPLRVQFDFEDSFVDLVNNVKTALRNSYRFQSFPLGHVIQLANAHSSGMTMPIPSGRPKLG